MGDSDIRVAHNIGRDSPNGDSPSKPFEILRHSLPRTFLLSADHVILGEKLGSSAFSSVHCGTLRGTTVAVKRMPVFKASSEKASKIALNELKLLLRLRHHNFVIQLIGYYLSDTAICIVMSYAENGDLQRYLQAGKLEGNWARKAQICKDIAKAADSVHKEHILHGVLNCSNILLDHLLTPKLTDFSVSRSGSSIDRGSDLGSSFRYIAPERLIKSSKGIPHKEALLSDIYSYAYVVWEVATDGLLPYNNIKCYSSMLTVKINTGEQLQFIGDFPEETPQVFRDTVKQCLAFDPFFRPSLSSVRDAFDNFIVIAPAPMDLPFTVCDDTPRSLLSPTFNNSEISDLRADVGDDKINALSEPQKELFEIAMHLYEDGKFTSAIERFQSPTLFWVTLAQRMVVHCHKAIGKNPSEVFQAFKGLAERSDARGQFCLAWCYDHRYGTQQDTKLAFRWYSSSMRAGNLAAAAVLRDMKWIENLYDVVVQWSTDASVFDFLRELFKSDDSRTFAITVLKCAREGDVRARYIYVIAYYSGSLLHHVDEHGRIYSELDDKFLISGGESFTIVVELSIYGNEMAQSEVERRIETAESDSNAGINFSESFRLLFEAAKKENSESPFCQRLIALCYELGVGVEKDVSKSLAFNSAAANAGDVRAQYKQFLQYQLGEGTEAHPELAFTWGLSAADTGRLGGQPRLGELHYDSIGATQSINLFSTAALAKAMYCLGRAHFYGRGANLDERAACRWFSRAANAGNADALWWAGLCHLHGHGTATDPQAAYAFFLKAADEGHAWAMYYVGEEYIEGNYLGRDLVKAKEYMAKAADGDINDAIMALRRPPLAEPAAEPAGEEASAPASNDPWQVLQKPNEPMPNEPMPNELTPDEPMPNEPMPDEPIPDEPIYPDESMIALPVYPDEAPPVYPHETPPANWAMVALRAPQPPANRLVLGLRAPSGGQSLSSTPKKRKFRFFWKRR